MGGKQRMEGMHYIFHIPYFLYLHYIFHIPYVFQQSPSEKQNKAREHREEAVMALSSLLLAGSESQMTLW